MFESQSRQNKVVKPCSDRSTAKHSVIGVSVTALGDDYHKRIYVPVTVYLWHVIEPLLLNGHMHDRVPSIGKNLQSYDVKDISIGPTMGWDSLSLHYKLHPLMTPLRSSQKALTTCLRRKLCVTPDEKSPNIQ